MKTFPYKTTIATYCEKNIKFKSINSINITIKAKYTYLTEVEIN